MIQVAFQRNKCIGCYACVEAAPEHWAMSRRDGKSFLRKSEKRGDYYIKNLPEPESEKLERSARNCPVRIIRVKRL
ncbi:MAG: ferredoxin [Phaeodactylibacter sp.]|nr:ferredoxin [Phaeodactylibacter sp.]MCB9273006.1 ferredoxin [Lewinellaceae bacterium]